MFVTIFTDGNFMGMAASLAVPYKGLRKAFRRVHFNHISFAAALADEMRVAQRFRIHFRLIQRFHKNRSGQGCFTEYPVNVSIPLARIGIQPLFGLRLVMRDSIYQGNQMNSFIFTIGAQAIDSF